MLGGLGCVVVNGGEYRVPLRFKKGLAYLPQTFPSNEELRSLPQVLMTSEDEWDPSKYNDTHLSTHDLLERIPKSKNVQENAWYDLYGDIKPQAIEANVVVTDDDVPSHCAYNQAIRH